MESFSSQLSNDNNRLRLGQNNTTNAISKYIKNVGAMNKTTANQYQTRLKLLRRFYLITFSCPTSLHQPTKVNNQMKLVNLTVSFQNRKEHNKDQADSTEFELPLILKSGLFPKAADLAIFKNHNETISKTPSDCSNSTIKEGEEKAWVSLETAN